MGSGVVVVVAGIIARNGRVLMRKRPPSSAYAGAWEFPGGKQEPPETVEECLQRELFEELGILAQSFLRVRKSNLKNKEGKPYVIEHLEVFRFHGEPRALEEGSELRWIDDKGAFLLGEKVTPGVVALSEAGYLAEKLGWVVTFSPRHRLVVKRSEWARGGESTLCKLENGKASRCCLGFYGNSLGIEDLLLDSYTMPSDTPSEYPWPYGFSEKTLSSESRELIRKAGVAAASLSLEGALVNVNDSARIDDTTRERLLTELFAQYLNVDVVFEP